MKLSELYPGKLMGKDVELTALVLGVSKKVPRLLTATWVCVRCGAHVDNEAGLKKAYPPLQCSKEDQGGCNRAGHQTKFMMDEGLSKWTTERWADLIEPPEEMRQNRPQITIPIRIRKKEYLDLLEQGHYVHLWGSLKAHDEADSKGAWKSVPDIYVDVLDIEVLNKIDQEMTEEELEQIREWAALPNPIDGVIVPSIAPDVEGHEECKAGLACVMFGGVDRQVGAKKMRGTIHQAMFGDPSTAKTRLMKFVHKAMPRSQYTTGPGATDKGLTAVLVPDEGRGYTIRAGLLPMAHESVALIDEVGQFKDEHWKAIEECMELQQVTRTGGGEHLPMQARTSIVVAGNPERGMRWDPHKGLQDQIKIPDSTLSRFDLVFLILDDVRKDEAIRDAIDQYHGVGDLPEEPPISPMLLSKYISHARHINPRPLPEATEIFHEAHRKMREEVEDSPFTIRTYESYLRLGQALARMRLSEDITAADANRAVRIHHAGWAALLDQQPDEAGSGKKLTKHDRMWNLLAQLDTSDDQNAGIEFKVWFKESDLPLDEFQTIVNQLHDKKRIRFPRHGVWKVVR